MKIVNYTPHDVVLKAVNGAETVYESKGIARVSCSDETIGLVNGVTIIRQKFGEIEGLPEKEDDTILIVSTMVRAAAKDRDDLVSPANFIRDEAGRIVAATALAK